MSFVAFVFHVWMTCGIKVKQLKQPAMIPSISMFAIRNNLVVENLKQAIFLSHKTTKKKGESLGLLFDKKQEQN
jgi:hypothetical protein